MSRHARVCLLVILLSFTSVAHARLTLEEYESLSKTASGSMALDAWFDGYAAGVGYMYRGAVDRKSPTPWCVPSEFGFSVEQMRAVADQFIVDTKRTNSTLPPKTPMEAVLGTALAVYWDCRKRRM